MHHTTADADVLIVMKAVEAARAATTVVVGDVLTYLYFSASMGNYMPTHSTSYLNLKRRQTNGK